jgi:hypothetical protein
MATKKAPNRNATRKAPDPSAPQTEWERALALQQPHAWEERVRRARTPEARLERVAQQLADLVADRARLVAERDELVHELRASGLHWSEIASLAGVTHSALVQRRGKGH